MPFIAGIPGSTQRLASCGLKHHTVTKAKLIEKEALGLSVAAKKWSTLAARV